MALKAHQCRASARRRLRMWRARTMRASAGGDGEGAGAGVVPAGLGGVVAGGVVTELAEHPGAGDDSEAGQAAEDRCVRVLAEMVAEDRLELGDLAGVRGDHRRRARRRWRRRRRRRPGPGSSCSARNAVWIFSARVSMLSWRPPRRSAEAIFERDSCRPRSGVGAIVSTATASRVAEVVEGVEGGGVELPQRRAEPGWPAVAATRSPTGASGPPT